MAGNERLKLAFMGSGAFALPALSALHEAGYDIAAVYCQPQRSAGRGMRLRPCPVQVAAERLGFPVRTPMHLRDNDDELRFFRSFDLDAAVVAAYGLILPAGFLTAPKRGAMNIHASLLPRWRGAAPIQAAILAGDQQTGVTIIEIDEGLDSGPILLAEAVPITLATTAPELHDRLAELGARLILRALAKRPSPIPQPEAGVTYAPRLSRADGLLDWSKDAASLLRRIRAFNPWPGTFTRLAGKELKILAAEAASGSGPAGTVLDEKLTIACGKGALCPTRLQRPGRPAMGTEAFLRGRLVPPGTRLGQ